MKKRRKEKESPIKPPAVFVVSRVVDGDTFKVREGWLWRKREGDTVRPTGYDTPERREEGFAEAKQRLTDLILNKGVEIRKAHIVDRWGRLVADVFYQDKSLADYFPEYGVPVDIYPPETEV